MWREDERERRSPGWTHWNSHHFPVSLIREQKKSGRKRDIYAYMNDLPKSAYIIIMHGKTKGSVKVGII